MSNLVLREVESLEIKVLMDNFTDILMSGSVGAERTPFGEDEVMRSAPIAEHGFSVMAKTSIDGREHSVLIDTGVTPDGVLVNVDRMKIDLTPVETVVITHGHVDHTAGLINILKRLSKRDLPVILHPQAFLKRWAVFPDGIKVRLPTLDRQLILEAGGKLVEITKPSLIAGDTMLVSGEIPRVTDFEKGLPISYAEIKGKLEKDPLIMDDMAVAFKVKEKGLVVISGCSHSGIVNTVKYLKDLTSTDVYAVLGGFHLTGKAFEPIIDRTIDELRKFKPTVVIPSHCTGWKALNRIYQEMPESYIQNAVGTTYTF
jgi:7,8-dihydropterin-6-yl-methyl-4-(beta-D-ribofuranosyl)aminobenzene 5'-phosphate synthase